MQLTTVIWRASRVKESLRGGILASGGAIILYELGASAVSGTPPPMRFSIAATVHSPAPAYINFLPFPPLFLKIESYKFSS